MHRPRESGGGKKAVMWNFAELISPRERQQIYSERAFYSVVSRARYNHALCLSRAPIRIIGRMQRAWENSPSAVLVRRSKNPSSAHWPRAPLLAFNIIKFIAHSSSFALDILCFVAPYTQSPHCSKKIKTIKSWRLQQHCKSNYVFLCTTEFVFCRDLLKILLFTILYQAMTKVESRAITLIYF